MKTKLHKNTVAGVVAALTDTFARGRHADKAIETVLKSNPRWGARDRSFIAETAYEIVRYHRLFEYLAQSRDYWHLVGVYLAVRTDETIPEWPEFMGIDWKELENRLQQARQLRVLRESVPDWIDQMLCDELSESVWEEQIAVLNKPADVWIRANTLKIPTTQLQKLLPVPTTASSLINTALRLENRKINLFQLPAFKEGFFEVQDLSSQMVAPFLRVEPGMRVVDACAGAGGKTLHLAALMQNKGKIIALDTEKWKLDELRRRARRAGAFIVETRYIEAKTIKRLEETADRLLLDVPCSGLGVLRRNPDTKWKLQPDFIQNLKATQAKILETYSRMLRPGGLMVYATCSILPSENERQIEAFLEKSEGKFKELDRKTILPTNYFSDGFFMSLIERMG